MNYMDLSRRAHCVRWSAVMIARKLLTLSSWKMKRNREEQFAGALVDFPAASTRQGGT